MLPSRVSSRAVLVGASSYDKLVSLPSVRNNVTDLSRLLRDETVWGLPDAHVLEVNDPDSFGAIITPLERASATAADMLVFYFAGHGIVGRGGELRLAIKTSESGANYSFLDYDEIRNCLLMSRARRKVVIIDCCYAGRALGGMTASQQVADYVDTEGTYILAAAAETKEAIAPLGCRYTAFTGELIEFLYEGVPEGPAEIDLQLLYQQLYGRLLRKALPLPQQRIRNNVARAAIAFNRAHARDTPRHNKSSAETLLSCRRTTPSRPLTKLEPRSGPTIIGLGQVPFKGIFDPSGKRIVACANETVIHVIPISLLSADVVRMRHNDGGVLSRLWRAVNDIDIDPTGTRVLSCGDDGGARLWDMNGRELLRVAHQHKTVYAGSFNSTGDLFATANGHGGVKIWDSMSGGLKRSIEQFATVATFSPVDPNVLAIESSSGVDLYDCETGNRSKLASGSVCAWVSFSIDGGRIAVADYRANILVWDIRQGKLLFQATHPNGWAHAITFHPSGEFIATAGRNVEVSFWDARDGRKIGTVAQPYGSAKPDIRSSVTFSDDGKKMLVSGRHLILWEFD